MNTLNLDGVILFLLHQLKDAITQNAIKLFIFVNTVSMKDTFIQVSLKVIVIRRYICPLCKHTISYIPHFCLPGFINALEHIFDYTYNSFHRENSINSVIRQLNQKHNIQFSRQILYYYRKKFIKNIAAIQNGLRQMIQGVKLPDETLKDTEKARNVLAIVTKEYPDIHLFSQKYYQATTKTFLATTK